MGSTQLSLIVVSIIRNKYLAVSIGPEGFGLFSLLTSFFQLGDIIAGAGLGTAIIKYIAEYNKENDQEGVQKVFDFSFSLVFLLATLITAVFFIFFPFFKVHFLTPKVLFLHYALFAASYMSTILSSVFLSLINGLLLIKSMAQRKFIISVFNLVSILIFVYLFELTGFFISILITSIFGLLVYYQEGRRWVKIRFKFPKFKDAISKKLISFSSIDIFLTLVNIGTNYLFRIIIVTLSGFATLGLYSSAVSLNKYLGIVGDGAQFYFFPKMSEVLEPDSRNKLLNDYFKMVILSSIAISIVAIILGPYLITILFSKQFSGLNNVFYMFVLAQFLLGIQTGFMYTLVGMVKMKMHSVTTIITHALMVVVPYLFLKDYGIKVLGITMIVSGITHIMINSTYLRIKHKVYMNRLNVLLTFIGLGLILGSEMIKQYPFVYQALYAVLSAGVVALFITKREWIEIFSYAKKVIKKYI